MAKFYVLYNKDKTKKKYIKTQSGSTGGYDYVASETEATTFTWAGARGFWLHNISEKTSKSIFALELESKSTYHMGSFNSEPLSALPSDDTPELPKDIVSVPSAPPTLAPVTKRKIGKKYNDGEFSMKSANIGVNQQKIVELNRNYDINYDNQQLIEKAKTLVAAYNDFYGELSKHENAGELQSYIDLALEDVKHVSEFSSLSAVSAFALQSLQQKLLRQRRMAKDSYDIKTKAKGLDQHKKTIDSLDNYLKMIEDRHYNFRTDFLEDIVIEIPDKRAI